jgi:nodulation protein E
VGRPRVVVTGMGALSAAGSGVDALWTAARSGKSAVGELELPRPGRNYVTIAAQLKGFDPEQYIESETLLFSDRFTQFAIVAADQALAQAGFERKQPLGARTAVIVGIGSGGINSIEDMLYAFHVLEPHYDPATNPSIIPRIPLTIPRAMGSAAPSQIGIRYGCTGPTFAVTSACSSANQAIGLGAFLVRSGVVDRALVGGSEAGITPGSVRAWETIRLLTPDHCRPFSRGRNGMVLGEGAGIFVLESAEVARARGAEPIAEILGYGTTSDAKDIIRPDPDGAAASMRLALEDAGLEPASIDYINAHGTGTVMNDAVEAEALHFVFGPRLHKVAVSSTKPIHGHALGAAGALELAITIMALREAVAPPTINWLGRDPECDLDVVPNNARQMPIRAAMSTAFAFGGINAVLVVGGPS